MPTKRLTKKERKMRAFMDGFEVLGRALCLTIVAAKASSDTEDEAIEAMVNKWRELGLLILVLADEGDDD